VDPLTSQQLSMLPRQLSSPEPESAELDCSSPEHTALPLPASGLERISHPNRRHSQKGHACGWIEERHGNKKRKSPTTSYFYCWLDQGQRKKRYVPSGKLYRVNQLLDQRRPVQEIVEFLQVKENGKSHQSG
jgi:hypothetical protein